MIVNVSCKCKFKGCTVDTGLRWWRCRLSYEQKLAPICLGPVKPMKRVSDVELTIELQC